MNLTLTVSMGVTANTASERPAPRPQANLIKGDKFPRSSTALPFKNSKVPKRNADLGMEPYLQIRVDIRRYIIIVITKGLKAHGRIRISHGYPMSVLHNHKAPAKCL